MDQVGLMMSSIGRWVREEKSFAITGGNLLLCLGLLLLLLGFLAGLKWDQLRTNVVVLGEKRYQLVGLAKPSGVQDEIYMPVYREVK